MRYLVILNQLIKFKLSFHRFKPIYLEKNVIMHIANLCNFSSLLTQMMLL